MKTEKVSLEGYISASNLQQASVETYTPSSHLTPPNQRKMHFSTVRSARISNSGAHGTKRPAEYSLPTGVQQLFHQSSSSSSFDSMMQQSLYKSRDVKI